MKNIKLLVIDDHPVIINGIRSMLEACFSNYTFTIEKAINSEQGINIASAENFDVIIIDYLLGNSRGNEVTQAIIAIKPDSKILGFSQYDDYSIISSYMKAGAKGYMLKNIESDEFSNAIESVLNGKNYYCNGVIKKLLDINDNSEKPHESMVTDNVIILSEKEKEILKLLAKGYTGNEISIELGYSKSSIDKYRVKIFERLKVQNLVGLIKKTQELKLD